MIKKLSRFVFAPYSPKYGALRYREGYFFDQMACTLGVAMILGLALLVVEVILMCITSNSLADAFFWQAAVSSTFMNVFVLIMCLFVLWFVGLFVYVALVYIERMDATKRHYREVVAIIPWEYPYEI